MTTAEQDRPRSPVPPVPGQLTAAAKTKQMIEAIVRLDPRLSLLVHYAMRRFGEAEAISRLVPVVPRLYERVSPDTAAWLVSGAGAVDYIVVPRYPDSTKRDFLEEASRRWHQSVGENARRSRRRAKHRLAREAYWFCEREFSKPQKRYAKIAQEWNGLTRGWATKTPPETGARSYQAYCEWSDESGEPERVDSMRVQNAVQRFRSLRFRRVR